MYASLPPPSMSIKPSLFSGEVGNRTIPFPIFLWRSSILNNTSWRAGFALSPNVLVPPALSRHPSGIPLLPPAKRNELLPPVLSLRVAGFPTSWVLPLAFFIQIFVLHPLDSGGPELSIVPWPHSP